MALGKKCARTSSLKLKRSDGFELGLISYTRAGLGSKRIGISDSDSNPTTPLKKQRSGLFDLECSEDVSKLEALPQEILIKILCGVEHEDLKQLFHVSKSIREATLIAKEWHFAYSTPAKVHAFRTQVDFSSDAVDEIEAPNAPRQKRLPRQLPSRKKLEEISVNLLDSLEQGMRKVLFVEDGEDQV